MGMWTLNKTGVITVAGDGSPGSCLKTTGVVNLEKQTDGIKHHGGMKIAFDS
jgi:hypothetical protein